MESKTAIIKDLFHPDGTPAGFYIEEVEGVTRTFEKDQDIVLKKCSNKDCNLVKPITEFYTGANTKDGYSNKCKACHSKHASKYSKKLTRNRRARDYGYSPLWA